MRHIPQFQTDKGLLSYRPVMALKLTVLTGQSAWQAHRKDTRRPNSKNQTPQFIAPQTARQAVVIPTLNSKQTTKAEQQ